MQEVVQAEKRSRGRPKERSDEETKGVIIDAANDQFKKAGYASASISAIAQTAGVSTKTLYRLFPAKADLFSDVISAKISRYFLGLNAESLSGNSLVEGLERLLIAYGRLTLSSETIVITRLVLSESDRFPELAAVFYEQAIRRTSKTMEEWLTRQVELKRVVIEDVPTATGMLRGMMAMEPQRAIMLGQIPDISDDDIVARARVCARIFVEGCGHT
ncbi:transcriptional regulator [Rhizobium sp. CF122]|uniref:TetR/AcrR family transcriptional regulator n=1 Tax=Rhizobium sp. CF122 TaxID=1144312 RepID=UPI000271D354|nr:TetR/AcrR family transcriptional regulator [Rhizobium sp. CF122]EJL54905.1 transcriptional regulator [Rhizobium sp. CF122]